MRRSLQSRWLRPTSRSGDQARLSGVQSCSSLHLTVPPPSSLQNRCATGRGFLSRQRRFFHANTVPSPSSKLEGQTDIPVSKSLPLQCHGCGAYSQSTHPDQAGYYDLSRKAIQKYLTEEGESLPQRRKDAEEEDYVVAQSLAALGEEKLAELGLDPKLLRPGEELDSSVSSGVAHSRPSPLCDRCHKLIHHHTGTPIYHPTIDAIRETIEETPYKYNHIYHVIDAADFPMSLMPRLHQALGDVSLRRKNRRSRAGRYYRDRKFDMSFIITRSDLLAPTEKQVNSLMPYLREVLRDALGDHGQVIRLGNLKCVSAKRSWWTKDLKQEIYRRGGAGWMVGKVNVGKSQLFDAVFPKGTTAAIQASRNPPEVGMFARDEDDENIKYVEDDSFENDEERLDVDALLPPARPEVNYPEMPTVSSLPGTTASPIRIPYGNGKGELIDLPGLLRSDLDQFVKEEHRDSLIMDRRIKPTQYSIKPGQSLLLGGLIRITPRTPGLVFLGYNFTPLPEHLTATDKAIAFQEQVREAGQVENFATPEAASKMEHAGSFKLRHDVTKIRAGPITSRGALNLKVDTLPYRVLSTDILIEGVGWIELTAQVRARDILGRTDQPVAEEKPRDPFAVMENLAREQSGAPRAKEKKEQKPPEPNWPVVDVYSPLGKFVGSRAPMNGWMLNKPRVLEKHKRSRPRKSMKGAKKREKAQSRAAAGESSDA